MEYDRKARARLGRRVREARLAAGFKRREDFAARAGRSGRQIQALENGESGVGPDTWTSVARALDWDPDTVFAELEGAGDPVPTPPPSTDVDDEELAANIHQLVDEVLSRLQRKRGEGDEPATMNEDAAAAARRAVDRQQSEADAAAGETGDEKPEPRRRRA